jgi:hypothetical protein
MMQPQRHWVRRRRLFVIALTIVVTAIAGIVVLTRTAMPHRTSFAYKVYGTGLGREPGYVGLTRAEAASIAPKFDETLVFQAGPSTRKAGTIVSQGLSFQDIYLMVSTGAIRDPEARLAGALGRPVASECDVTVSYTQDGNVYPVTCGRSHVDVEAWVFYESLLVNLHLGATATKCQLLASEERVFKQGNTAPEIENAAELAGAYYGWSSALLSVPLVTNPPPWISTCGAAVVRGYTG